MLSKSKMELVQQYMERDVQPRISEVVKCGAGILVVVALALLGPIIGIDPAARAAELVTLLDPRVLEHLAGI